MSSSSQSNRQPALWMVACTVAILVHLLFFFVLVLNCRMTPPQLLKSGTSIVELTFSESQGVVPELMTDQEEAQESEGIEEGVLEPKPMVQKSVDDHDLILPADAPEIEFSEIEALVAAAKAKEKRERQAEIQAQQLAAKKAAEEERRRVVAEAEVVERARQAVIKAQVLAKRKAAEESARQQKVLAVARQREASEQAAREKAAAEKEADRRASLAKQLSRQPAVISRRSPTYPTSARRAGIEGRVVLSVRISTSGRVSTVALQQGSGHSSLDKAAILAVKRWRYQPAINGLGQAIASQKSEAVRFALE